MSTLTRRLVAVVATPALTLGALAAVPTSAHATQRPATQRPATQPSATAATTWLASQVDDGAVVGPFGPDYGLSIDALLAFTALRGNAPTRAQILSRLSTSIDAYTTGEAFGDTGSRYAGATGKLTAAVQIAGRNPRTFGGRNLVTLAEGVVVDSGPEKGRGSDVSTFGDFSNTVGQSWLVRALTRAGSSEARAATSYLRQQQCPDGSFRLSLYVAGPDGRDRRCGDPTTAGDDDIDVDATTFAIAALDDASSRVRGLRPAIRKAVAWLRTQQAADGSFRETAEGPSNANSTGLAAIALAENGERARARKAADWVRDQQLPRGGAVGADAGAIAYVPADRQAAVASGIDDDATRDRFRRATAQAAPSLALRPRSTSTR